MMNHNKDKPLNPPKDIQGRMTKWTSRELMKKRLDWALARGAEGHTATAIAEALGITVDPIRLPMIEAGYAWYKQPRKIRRKPKKQKPKDI